MAEENRTIDINEATILGNILFDNTGNQMLTAVQHLSAEDFTDPRNRAVYQAMLEINSHGETPDMALVVETLKNDKTFDYQAYAFFETKLRMYEYDIPGLVKEYLKKRDQIFY